jgi:hypothetical protein
LALEARPIDLSNHISLDVSHDEHAIDIFTLFGVLLAIYNIDVCN